MQSRKILKCFLVLSVSLWGFLVLESCKKRQKASVASAEVGDPYLFVGGACQTSGRWVAAAISQAQQIKSVITALRDDPKCTSLVNSMDQLVANTEQVGSGPGSDPKGTVAQMFGISREITALSQYRRARARAKSAEGSGANEDPNANVDKIMTDRMFQMLGLNNDVADATDTSADGAPAPRSAAFNEANQVVDQVINMKARALRTASTGLDIAANVFDNLAADQQCLVGRTSSVGSIAIAGAKLLGAYVGSDSGLSAKAGSAIAAYFKFLKDQKFNDAIREINESEFLLSISCLMETTSANYCAVRDAQYLQEDLMSKVGGLKTYWKPEEQQADLMTGFKVLNQDVPVVADWLRKVVTGVTPRRRADADYYNSVMGSLNGLQQILTTAQTAIQETKYNLPKEDLQQRKSVYDLAQKLQEIFQSSGEKLDSSRTGALPDFYGMASPEIKQLFDILGMDLPRECDSSLLTPDTGLRDPTDYLEAGGKYDRFGSPIAVLERMDTNVKIIFDRMSMLVTAYVRNNLNIDQPNVATDFVSPSASGNALERIQQIRSYLVSLCIRISDAVKNKTARAEDKSFARLFMDTILRIDRVLDAQQKILDDFEEFRPEFEDFIEKEKNRKTINLSLNGDSGSSEIETKLRQRFEERYKGKGAQPEDQKLMAALQMVFPNDGNGKDQSMDQWFIKEAAAMELGRLKATKSNNPKLRAAAKTGLNLSEGDVSTAKMDTAIYGVLLNSAFDQFDMLRFREGFFINRVAKAVYWDISKQLVAMQRDYDAAQQNPSLQASYKAKWSNVSQRLMMMADNFVVDKLNNLVPKDLQASMLDQSKAVIMNQANLSAMTVFKDSLMKQISRLKSIEKGRTSDWQMQADLIHDTVWNPYRPLAYAVAEKNKAVMKRAVGRAGYIEGQLLTAVVENEANKFDAMAGIIGRWVRPDLYWSPYFWTDKTYFQDDEFGSLKTFRGLLCMQTLAFADPTPFRTICEGAVLQSVFEKNGPAGKHSTGAINPEALSMSYNDWMDTYDVYKGKNDLNARKFQGRRICAVHDHLRNNTIHMIKLRNRGDAQVISDMVANQK